MFNVYLKIMNKGSHLKLKVVMLNVMVYRYSFLV